ncbi:hypothetical protein QQF64_006930, partial [Cirrhinus molitorella]
NLRVCGGPGAKAVSAHDRPQLIHPTTAHECDGAPAHITVETGALCGPADVPQCRCGNGLSIVVHRNNA